MSRIAQVANFVAPHSGGIRTVLGHLAAGYAAAGHEVLQIVPGARSAQVPTPWGCRQVLAGVSVPGTGYRVLRRSTVERTLAGSGVDRLEVHDRTTLRGLGGWARHHGVRSCVVSHERLDRLLMQWSHAGRTSRRVADLSNARLAAGFAAVVCTTTWAAAEFARLEVRNLHVVPLGVDLDRFRPGAPPQLPTTVPPGTVVLAMVSRLSPEKRPDLGVKVVAELVRRGVPVALFVAGHGPLRRRLEAEAARLPVTFLGHLHDRDRLVGLLRAADVVLAPGPVETFGLGAVEALACGIPVVVDRGSALRDIVGPSAGASAAGTPEAFADAVQEVLRRPAAERQAAARTRAETFAWPTTVQGFLRVHQVN